MLVREKELSARTKWRLLEIVVDGGSNLPDLVQIPDGITLQDLGNTGSHMDRFNNGKFRITRGEENWILDGGVHSYGITLKWEIKVETETGDVIATPVFISKISGSPVDCLKEALGLESRTIGSLGRLEPLFPTRAEGLLTQTGYKKVYATISDVEQFRAQLKALL